MPWSSNGTYLVQVTCGDDHAPAIYKPAPRNDRCGTSRTACGDVRSRPGSCPRSSASTWCRRPSADTSGRWARGPCRPSCRHVSRSTTSRCRPGGRRDDRCAAAALRAGPGRQRNRPQGWPLPRSTQEDRLWAIDNGLSFHREFKLRTVIWDFAGEEIPGDDARTAAAPGGRGRAGPPRPLAVPG